MTIRDLQPGDRYTISEGIDGAAPVAYTVVGWVESEGYELLVHVARTVSKHHAPETPGVHRRSFLEALTRKGRVMIFPADTDDSDEPTD